MHQLSFFQELKTKSPPVRRYFSHNGVCSDEARQALEKQYAPLLVETGKFNRQLVSFQANKTEILHGWFKYREGFSAELVELLFDELQIQPADTILDPFAGSATTLLAAQLHGMNGVGIELLPHCHLAWQAKSAVFDYNLDELRQVRSLVEESSPPPVAEPFPHLTITESAFPPQVEADLMAYTRWFEKLDVGPRTKMLCRFILMSLLEDVSYTRKDGQYLRWDRRAEKIRRHNEKRQAQGKKPIRGIDKGAIPTVKQTFLERLSKIIVDVSRLQAEQKRPESGRQELIEGSTLYILPTLPADSFDAVITSPPYANRYDYTRTYALELAYLGIDDKIFNLRQNQLSCTVENKSKENELRAFYHSMGQGQQFERILTIVGTNEVLAEINAALATRYERGEVNNRGILTMIAQYFLELTFVFAELYRVCRRGARVAVVNDNVRYAGEIIPVDTLSTALAEQVGFAPKKIYVLPQRKGNSSQQMGRFGREPLRKSITIWQKV